ncbi:MAG: 50S ribosomal protein L25/general stress protein Ctc [Actinobacteria bacterium 69-20]|nr:50S ribosomal protein L25/general stress protein Ctc [Actinomycetota bacterium]OJV28156.1 MAG: 50S ribosomal protein L25/general stress protein Ctc [Actinobacteria bacterium 69-20]
MTDTIRLVGEKRTEFGKGAARRARAAGLVPAVLYGHGSETHHFTLPAREFARAVKGDANRVLTVVVDGEEHLALPRAVVRHPIKDYFQHVDLLIVRRGEKVTVDVPVHLVGEAAPGTLVLHETTQLAIDVDALAIPERLEVSLDGLDAGDIVHAGSVALPAGATLVTDAETVVVAVQTPVAIEEPEPEAAAVTTAEAAPAAES